MSSLANETLWDIVRGNMFWIVGNTALAWAGVLFLWITERFSNHATVASAIVIACATALPTVRLLRHGDHSADRIAVMVVSSAALGAVAAFWARAARRGDRWAFWLAVLGAVAFAPNAPYVLTDGMHFVQDVRRIDLALPASIVLALLYGWFFAIALTAWIILVRTARAFVPARRWVPVLIAVCFVMAAGIYIGRIVRVNSWQLVTRPDQVVVALSDIVMHAGPAIFTVVWALVVLLVSCVGVASADHAERALQVPYIRRLICGWAWLLSGAWLIGMPFVRAFDPYVDVATATPSTGAVLGAGAIGGALVVLGLERIGLTYVPRPRRALIAIAALIVLGPLLVLGSTVGWWAQYRSLCHHGPAQWMNERRCVDNRAA